MRPVSSCPTLKNLVFLSETIDLLQANRWSSATLHSFASDYMAVEANDTASSPSELVPTPPTILVVFIVFEIVVIIFLMRIEPRHWEEEDFGLLAGSNATWQASTLHATASESSNSKKVLFIVYVL